MTAFKRGSSPNRDSCRHIGELIWSFCLEFMHASCTTVQTSSSDLPAVYTVLLSQETLFGSGSSCWIDKPQTRHWQWCYEPYTYGSCCIVSYFIIVSYFHNIMMWIQPLLRFAVVPLCLLNWQEGKSLLLHILFFYYSNSQRQISLTAGGGFSLPHFSCKVNGGQRRLQGLLHMDHTIPHNANN